MAQHTPETVLEHLICIISQTDLSKITLPICRYDSFIHTRQIQIYIAMKVNKLAAFILNWLILT